MIPYTESFAKKQRKSMKKSIKLILAQFVFLSSFFLMHAATGSEGPYDNLFFYAQSLYTAGAYEEAEVEYKRYIFMQNYAPGQSENLTNAFCALAELYEKKEQWELAAETIQNAINSIKTTEESEGNEQFADSLRITHIKYLYKAFENSKAFLSDNLYIFSYMNLPQISELVRQCAYSAAISNAIISGRLEYAEQTFSKAMELFPQGWDNQQREIIISQFQKLNSFKPKNQKLAGYLSFIPGLGQLYAANYKDSLNAFLLNGSLIAVSVWSICTLDFWTFSLLEFNPIIRFMQGNIYNAQKDAYQYNLKKQQELSAPILQELTQ